MKVQKLPDGRVIAGLPHEVTLATTDLVRNHDSVHRRWCYHVRNSRVVVWAWPDGKSREWVAMAARNGLRFCRSCKPLEQLPARASFPVLDQELELLIIDEDEATEDEQR